MGHWTRGGPMTSTFGGLCRRWIRPPSGAFLENVVMGEPSLYDWNLERDSERAMLITETVDDRTRTE